MIFILGDLRDIYFCRTLFDGPYDRIYQLAADMGGAGYIFSGENDATIMSKLCTNQSEYPSSVARDENRGLLFFFFIRMYIS